MTHKRLTRDQKWGFQYYPYHQVRIESEIFTGWAALIYLTDGQELFWEYPKAGKIPVAGEGMCWLTLIPENRHRSITAMFTRDRRISGWYIDVIERVAFHEDGVLGFIDKYLDVIMTPAGDIIIDDRNELDDAYHSGELTTKQYEDAIAEGESIVAELGSDIAATQQWCIDVLKLVEEKTMSQFTIFLDVDGVLDIYNDSDYLQNLLPEAIDRLAGLVKRSMGKVVIVSDWRYGKPECSFGTERQRGNWKNLVEALDKRNIAVSDVTSFEVRDCTRTDEIRKYLSEHSDIKNYVILDDCYGDDYTSDPGIREHLVFVDALKGLQDRDLIKVCEIMNRQFGEMAAAGAAQ